MSGFAAVLLVAAFGADSAVATGSTTPKGEWHHYGADGANTKYAPLDQIDASNFGKLQPAWEWESISREVTEKNPRVRPGQFKSFALYIDGLVYVASELSQVAAIDPATGNTVWSYDPESYEAGRPANVGWQHRGVSYWTDGTDERIFIATHDRKLIAVNAKTGKPYPDFGENGKVDLENTLGRKVNPRHITHSSPTAICRDTVIVGSIVHDGPTRKEAPPGHVRGYDVRTGEMKWRFHTIPQEGEFGNETWEDGAWQYTGASNVWSMMAVDEALGYVYLPTGTPTNDMYGGHRKGDNLFAESLVCLNAETGERVWHFQAVHHGLWDYDFPTGPNLVDITVDGKPIKAVAQVSKQAFTYVFDRATGKPVWPIEERAVPQSTVPGEQSAPTQPFPTKPAAFDRQGITEDDLIDFTPELRDAALELLKNFKLGPIFTPPSTKDENYGTIFVPGSGGGANWPGAAFDPETGILYVPSVTSPAAFPLVKPDPNISNFDWVHSWFTGVPRVQGLPLLKPPYARVTAIDLNSGEHLWMTPNGDGPRNHPAIRHLNVGPLGTSAGGPLLTKTLLFVGQDRGLGENNSPRLNVFDKATGKLLGHLPLPDTPNGCPSTYMHNGKQYIVIAVGGGPFFSAFNEEDIETASKESGIDPATLRALSQIPSTTPKLVAYTLP